MSAPQTTRPDVNPLDIHLRPAQARDEAFLRQVHDAGRAWEFEMLRGHVDDHLLATVYKHQYGAQHDAYFNAFTLAKYAVIEWCGEPVGRVYADFRDHEIRLLDINVLPAYRGRRIGEIVIRGLCGAASQQRVPLTLQVNPLNPARALYVRLGFISQGFADEGTPGADAFIEMAWRDPLTTPEQMEASPG